MLAAVLAAAGCKSHGDAPPPAPKLILAAAPADAAFVPHKPVPPPPLPGLAWQTPHQAFRLPFLAGGVALDGDTLLVAGYGGVLARLDLATGEIVDQRDFGPVSLHGLLRLDAREWIVVGTRDKHTVAFSVDAETLAATPIRLSAQVSERGYAGNAVRLSDGTVVIAGPGIPLASYDPATWQVRKVIDPDLGWHGVLVRNDHVIALGLQNVEIDVETGARNELGYATSITAAGPYVAQWSTADTLAVRDLNGNVVYHSDDVVVHATFGADGRVLATVSGGVARIVELPSGKVLATFPMSHAAHAFNGYLDLDARHLVVVGDGMVRVADLRTGTVSPEGAAPFGPSGSVRVSNDGVVTADHMAISRYENGNVLGTIADGEESWLTPPADDASHAGILGDGNRPIVKVLDATSGASIASWRSPQFLISGWFGRKGNVVLEGSDDMDEDDNDIPRRLLRSQGGQLVPVTKLASSTEVLAVDVDANVAVLALGGVLTVIDTRTGRRVGLTQNTPGCQEVTAIIEPHGSRILFWTDRDAYIWDRKTNAIVATMRTMSPIERAVFVPGHNEVILSCDDELASWILDIGALSTIPNEVSAELGVSPNGKWLALGGDDSRISLVDLATLRAALTGQTAQATAMQALDCPGGDLFNGD